MSDLTSKDSTETVADTSGHERGEKRSAEAEDAVNSANNWEKVDLGGDERKQKFLRLMGASKKEHHGRFVIGEKEQYAHHGNSGDEVQKMTTELESQYQQGVEMKLTGASRQHRGFGFHGEEPEAESTEKAKTFVKSSESAATAESTNGDKKNSETGASGKKPETSEPKGEASGKKPETHDPKGEASGKKPETSEPKEEASGSEEPPKKESKGPVQVPDISESS